MQIRTSISSMNTTTANSGDLDMMMEPKCFTRNCKHFIGAIGEDEVEQVVVCAAFPDGIPFEIAYGVNLHTKPFEGDHGIRYEKASNLSVKLTVRT